MRPFILLGLALFAVLAGLFAIRSDRTHNETTPPAPRILRMEVLNAEPAVLLSSEKSEQGVKTYLVEGDSIELRARVDGVDSIEATVSISSGTSLGHYTGYFLDDGLAIIDIELPVSGSQWQVPGAGATGQAQTLTISDDQAFILQVTGTSTRPTSNNPIVVSTSVRVIREH